MDSEKRVAVCVECGKEFEITEGWLKMVEEKPGFQLPKRCAACRLAKKRRNENNLGGSTRKPPKNRFPKSVEKEDDDFKFD